MKLWDGHKFGTDGQIDRQPANYMLLEFFQRA